MKEVCNSLIESVLCVKAELVFAVRVIVGERERGSCLQKMYLSFFFFLIKNERLCLVMNMYTSPLHLLTTVNTNHLQSCKWTLSAAVFRGVGRGIGKFYLFLCSKLL